MHDSEWCFRIGRQVVNLAKHMLFVLAEIFLQVFQNAETGATG